MKSRFVLVFQIERALPELKRLSDFLVELCHFKHVLKQRRLRSDRNASNFDFALELSIARERLRTKALRPQLVDSQVYVDLQLFGLQSFSCSVGHYLQTGRVRLPLLHL